MSQADWEYLLSLNGITFVVDESLGFWVKFEAYEIGAITGIPHGIRYSLTLHSRSGTRLLGFDNAHPIGKSPNRDHWHRDRDDSGRKYEFVSPEQLLADFWREVDRILKERAND